MHVRVVPGAPLFICIIAIFLYIKDMKALIFPDQTRFDLHQTLSILDVSEGQKLVAYIDKEAGTQILWVPDEFIVDV